VLPWLPLGSAVYIETEWIKAIIEEVGSLIKNQMWELVNLTSLKPPYKPLAGK